MRWPMILTRVIFIHGWWNCPKPESCWAAKSLADLNLEKGEAFLSRNKDGEGVVSLESGLQYKVIKEGNGKSPLADDEVEVPTMELCSTGRFLIPRFKRDEPAEVQCIRCHQGLDGGFATDEDRSQVESFHPVRSRLSGKGKQFDRPERNADFRNRAFEHHAETPSSESFDSNTSDLNSSSGTAPLIIPEAEGNTTAPESVPETNASASPAVGPPAESNDSE